MRKVGIEEPVNSAFYQGAAKGKSQMEEKLLLEASGGMPISIHDRIWFVISDMQHLRLMLEEREPEPRKELAVYNKEEIGALIFQCVSDLYLTEKPRQEIADTLLKCLYIMDKSHKERG